MRGRLDAGDDLPRIAPPRIGAELRFESGCWRAHAGAVRYDVQDDVAPLESATPGFTLLDAHVGCVVSGGGDTEWELYVDGRNLGNERALLHMSFIKEQAPLPGRTHTLFAPHSRSASQSSRTSQRSPRPWLQAVAASAKPSPKTRLDQRPVVDREGDVSDCDERTCLGARDMAPDLSTS